MLRKKLAESLTARIFLITALILLCAGTVTFGMIAWATPLTYTSVFNDDLARQVDDFAATLADTNLEDCGPLLDGFIRSSGDKMYGSLSDHLYCECDRFWNRSGTVVYIEDAIFESYLFHAVWYSLIRGECLFDIPLMVTKGLEYLICGFKRFEVSVRIE